MVCDPIRAFVSGRPLAALATVLALAAGPASGAAIPPGATQAPELKAAPTQQLAPGEVPKGLGGAEWAGIQQQIDAARYQVTVADAAQEPSRAVNHALGITAHFGADGATRVQVSGSGDARASDSASLRLSGIGYRQLAPVGAAPERVAEGGKLTYRWSQQVTEWWVNQPGRLEQWFRIEQRPAGAPRATDKATPLRLAMALQTELKPVLVGQQLQFKDQAGATRLQYDRLKVWDAQGTELPARMQLAGRTLTLAIDDAKAQYPLTIDPSWAQQAYIKASNTGANDRFGTAVALSGDTLAVGAPWEDSNAQGVNGNQANDSTVDAGAVYVFTRSGGAWNQQAYIKASNAAAGDQFGQAVALSLSGDTLVVGAPQEDGTAQDSGAAYVFTRNGGTWSQQARIKASNAGAKDQFGYAVSLSGDTLAVGAFGEASNATGVGASPSAQADDSAPGSGAVYVFTRSGTAWSQQAYIKASNTRAGDKFGQAVSLSGNTLAVGAPDEGSTAVGINGNQTNNSPEPYGAVYVFTRSGTTWSQQAYIKGSDTHSYAWFGLSVSVADDTLAVGAPRHGLPIHFSGAVYVFTRSGGLWEEQALIKASNAADDTMFGRSVSLSGNTLAVGAPWERGSATGVNGDQTQDSFKSGAAYTFTRSGATWSQQAYIKASNTQAGDEFGHVVSLSGNMLAVGAIDEDSNATGVGGDQTNNSAGAAGAVYAFQLGPVVTPSVSAAGGGSIDPATPQVVLNNGTASFTLTPDAGYGYSSLTYTCGGSLVGNIYTTGPVTHDCSVTVSFAPTVEGACGSANGVPAASAPTANLCSAVSASTVTRSDYSWRWSCFGSYGGSTASCSAPLIFDVTPSVGAGGGGSISPAGAQSVPAGGTASFTLTPAEGHAIASVGGTCGGNLAGNTYTTAQVIGNCTVVANFAASVTGACGSANGVAVTKAPTADLCRAGSESVVTGSGPWSWSCSGWGGGATASCGAPAFTPVTHFEGPSATGSGTVVVDLEGGGPFCGFTGTPTLIAAAPGASPATPAGITFPHGLFSFTASNCTPGDTITLKMKLPTTPPAGAKYWKWGPQLGNTTPHWYELPATIVGDTVTFSITDGAQGDGDLDATNGSIVDPGGPGVPAAVTGSDQVTPIPTLGEWALMLLGLAAAGLGALRLRHRV